MQTDSVGSEGCIEASKRGSKGSKITSVQQRNGHAAICQGFIPDRDAPSVKHPELVQPLRHCVACKPRGSFASASTSWFNRIDLSRSLIVPFRSSVDRMRGAAHMTHIPIWASFSLWDKPRFPIINWSGSL